jgi:hypothetical protein
MNEIDTINSELRLLCDHLSIKFVSDDIYYDNASGTLRPNILIPDGLHLTPDGLRILCSGIKRATRSLDQNNQNHRKSYVQNNRNRTYQDNPLNSFRRREQSSRNKLDNYTADSWQHRSSQPAQDTYDNSVEYAETEYNRHDTYDDISKDYN